jgi:RND family efflux transporter MFP subunit
MKLYTTIIALLLTSTIILTSCSNDQTHAEQTNDKPVQVTLANAVTHSGSTIQSSGQIVSIKTAMISTRMMGFITGIKVKTGDNVKSGQLVTISNEDIIAKRAQAVSMLTEAEAALKDAKKDYERYTQLFQQQSASQKELENITLNYNSIKSKAEAARQMKNEAEAQLAYANLTAPFDGVVTQKNMDAGSMANPGVPILVIEQSGSFQVNTSVTESDIDQIKVGADAKVIIESIDKIIAAKVSEVSPSSQMSGGQYLIKISIPDHEKSSLHSGMFAKVLISISGQSANLTQQIMVPATAIVSKDQLNGLYTISQNKTALLRWVKLGSKQGDNVEVLSGLSGNEQFILSAEGKLYNGVPVAVK